APLTFFIGNQEPVETGITNPEAWYQVEINFNLMTNEVQLTIGEESYTSSLESVSFDGSIDKLKLVGIRTSGNNHTWTTYLDNVEINHLSVQENAISAVNKIPYQRVYVGETTEDIASIGLPETVPVSLANGSTVDAEVASWQEVD